MEGNNDNNFFSSIGNFITDFIEKSSSLGKNWEEIQSIIESYERLSNLSEEELKSVAYSLEEFFPSVPSEEQKDSISSISSLDNSEHMESAEIEEVYPDYNESDFGNYTPTVRASDSGYTMMMEKAATYLFRGDSNPYKANSMEVKFSKTGDDYVKRNITIFVLIAFKNRNINKYIDGFDQTIYNAIATLYRRGYRFFTAKDVFQAYTGERAYYDSILDEIDNRITRMMGIFLFLDYRGAKDEYRLGGFESIEGIPILELRIHQRKNKYNAISDRVEYVYEFKLDSEWGLEGIPILYRICLDWGNKQTTIPYSSLTKTRKILDYTPENIAIQDYLLYRIRMIKNPRTKTSNKILLDSIYEATNIKKPSNRTQQKRIRDKIFMILDTLKDDGIEESEVIDHKTKKKLKKLTISEKGMFAYYTKDKKGKAYDSVTIKVKHKADIVEYKQNS